MTSKKQPVAEKDLRPSQNLKTAPNAGIPNLQNMETERSFHSA